MGLEPQRLDVLCMDILGFSLRLSCTVALDHCFKSNITERRSLSPCLNLLALDDIPFQPTLIDCFETNSWRKLPNISLRIISFPKLVVYRALLFSCVIFIVRSSSFFLFIFSIHITFAQRCRSSTYCKSVMNISRKRCSVVLKMTGKK
jgi:hypothetical protein